ncbi:Mth938-like domain-containing protein [Sedimenticola selenatireducens]|uniref:Mth938-like domain-containing protein n=1 Tax=Sedimenticola selenatireducens TaxID=191960 RepID=UPI0021B297C9|nr:Mth938-like domain-containing protein [Sedimenticola selenatireducens]
MADQSIGNIIQAYTDESVMVNGVKFTRSLVIMAEQIIPDWKPESFEGLTEADFVSILEMRPDLVVLGTGPKQQFPMPALYQSLTNAGIGVEVMNTPAACRTYNILTSEGRKVIAALLFG